MNETTTRLMSVIGLIILGIITVIALWDGGLTGFFEGIIHSWATLQIYVDLVIAIVFLMVWMWRDAKASGRNPWPWLIAALIVGSFSPLVYLLVRETREKGQV